MQGADDSLDASQLQTAINHVQGVIQSRVVSEEGVTISEIHVMASTDRTPKQMVRDIESLLFVRFGIKVDYRKISLVQLEEEQITPLALSRLRLVSVDFVEGSEGLRAEVKIESPRGVQVGVEVSEEEGSDRAPLVAAAALDALQQVVGGRAELSLGALSAYELNGRQVMVVQVSYLFPAGEESLLGVSYVAAGGEAEAAARAALDAVNRRLPVIGLT